MFNINDALNIMTYQIEKSYNILYLEIKELMGTGHSQRVNGDGPQYIVYYKRNRSKIVSVFDLKVLFL